MKTYYCDCEKYCQGERKVVSKTTFFNHKKYRESLTNFTPQFQEYLSRHPVVAPISGPSRHSEVVADLDVSIISHWHSRAC